MNQLDDKLMSAMSRLAEAPPRDGLEEELASNLTDRQRKSTRARLLPIVGGLAAAACSAVLLAPHVARDPATTHTTAGAQSRLNGLPVVGPGEPCHSATHLPVPTLAEAANLTVWLPADNSGFKVGDSWACNLGGAPVLMFGKIQVSYEAGWKDVDVSQEWNTQVADMGGRVENFGGYPAMIHTGNDAAPNNEVMFVVGDTLVRLLSVPEVPIDDVVRLAESLAANAPKS